MVIFAILGAAVIYSAANNLCFDCTEEEEPDQAPSKDYCGTPCDPANGVTCEAPFECVEGQCLDVRTCGACGQSCADSSECAAGLSCTKGNVCFSETLCPPFDASVCLTACTRNRDCGPYLRCEFGACVGKGSAVCSGCGASCDTDADCSDGLSCIPHDGDPPDQDRKICYSSTICQPSSGDSGASSGNTSEP